MFEGAIAGLMNLGPMVFAFMLLGIVVTQAVVVVPGLGGHFVLALLLPFTFALDPLAAIAMIVGASVTTGTGNTITSVLFGVPGSPTGVATVFDGYPMAQRGEGVRAVAAGLTASAAGGLIGALVLGLVLPVVRPIVLALGSPEFFVLIAAALIAMAYVGSADMVKALMAGGLGILLAFVGQDITTGELRYTFGQLYLWDGIQLVPFFIGLFAIAEMLDLISKGGSIASDSATAEQSKGGIRRGFMDVVHHPRATIQSSLSGIVVGMVPGLGGATSQFIAYAQVAKTSKERKKFGKGAVEGVIASDASVNATDAGQMVPTLAFGIPGSATAAILLAAFMAVGVQPGPEMLESHLDLLWMVVWILVFANLLATSLTMLAVRPLGKLTFIPVVYVVPVVLLLSFFGSYLSTRHLADVAVAVAFGFLGMWMKRYGYSRATMVIGFVLGALVERHYLLAMRLFGLEFLLRPVTLGLIIVFTIGFLGPVAMKLWRRQRSRREERRLEGHQDGATGEEEQ